MEKGAGKNPNYYPDKLQEVADQKAAKDRVREAEEESAQEKRDAKAKALLDSKKNAKKDKDAKEKEKAQAKEKALVRCAWLYECHRWLMGRPPPPLVHAWPDCAFPPLLRASATRGSYLQAAAGPSPPSRTSARRTTNT